MLKEHVEGSLVVVGNAPTALLSVSDLIRGGKARPSMIVGTPVGFVQALESKRYLQSLGVPFVTVEGTRGGSAVAVAATNALLQLAVEDSVSGESSRS
jgi:precorrin-8X/cobalt-precorrin-8 methylmutase